jgi:photosystem II stability/assembly factor-like uncharacterized protein
VNTIDPANLRRVSLSRQQVYYARYLNPFVRWKHRKQALIDLTAVHMADPAFGWAVGKGGVILKTEDGGRHWLDQDSGTTEDLWGVRFLDPIVGYAVGAGHTILRTEDGGQNWIDPRDAPQHSENVVLRDVFLLSPEIAVAVGGTRTFFNYTDGVLGLFLRTTDGGSRWTMHPQSTEIEGINAVHFMNATTGIAVGGLSSFSYYYNATVISSIIAKTTDGGITWAKRQSPWDLGPVYGYEPWGKPIHDVAFCDDARGVIAGGPGVPLAFSTDGGESWGGCHGICGFEENSLCYVDADTLVAVGACNGCYVIRSINGGIDWAFAYERSSQTTTPANLMSVSFSGMTGVAVGYGSSVVRSDDGGASWEEVGL